MLSNDTIKALQKNPNFLEFQNYILEKMYELDSISGLELKPKADIGEVVKARSTALVILKEILNPVMEFQEKTEITDKEIKKKEKSFGL